MNTNIDDFQSIVDKKIDNIIENTSAVPYINKNDGVITYQLLKQLSEIVKNTSTESVFTENLIGIIDGQNATFTTSFNFSIESVIIFLNGMILQKTIDWNNSGTQTINAATTALLVGSLLSVPVGKLQIGTIFKFTFDVTKTAAGTAANTFLFKLGTLGTTSDPTILTFTTGIGTAAIDTGTVQIIITIRGPLSGSCIAQGNLLMTHNLAATGLLTVPANSINATSSVFDATVANLKASISCTTAALTVLTFQQIFSRSINL